MSDDLDIEDDGAATSDRKPRPNSQKKSGGGGDAHGVARDQLRAFIERLERLDEEKKTVLEDIKDVKGEAKAAGFDVGIINKILAIRKKDKDEYAEEQAVLETYLSALGMLVLDSIGDDDD